MQRLAGPGIHEPKNYVAAFSAQPGMQLLAEPAGASSWGMPHPFKQVSSRIALVDATMVARPHSATSRSASAPVAPQARGCCMAAQQAARGGLPASNARMPSSSPARQEAVGRRPGAIN